MGFLVGGWLRAHLLCLCSSNWIMKPQVFGGENASTTRSLRCWCCWRWSFIDTQQEWFLHSTLKSMVSFPPFPRNGIRHWDVFLGGHDIKKYRKNSDQPPQNHDRIIWKALISKWLIVLSSYSWYDSIPTYTSGGLHHSLLASMPLPQPLTLATARNHTTAPVKGVRPMGKHSDNLLLARSRFGGEHLIPQNQNQRIINCNLA